MSSVRYGHLNGENTYDDESYNNNNERASDLSLKLHENMNKNAIFGLDDYGMPFFIAWDNLAGKFKEKIPVHKVQLYDYSAVTMKNNDTMLFCGGITRAENKISSDFYEYTFSNNIFKKLSSLNEAKYDFSIIYVNEKLYAVGGMIANIDRHSATGKCEVFDYKTMRWNYIDGLNYPRTGHCIINYNKNIYCFGGFSDKSQFINKIEKYCLNRNKWEVVDFKFPIPLNNIQIYPADEPNEVFMFGEVDFIGFSNIWKLNLLHGTIIYVKILPFYMYKAKCFKFIDNSIYCVYEHVDKPFYSYISLGNTISMSGDPEFPLNIKENLHKVNSTKFPVNVRIKDDFEIQYAKRNYINKILYFGTLLEPFQLEIDVKTNKMEVFPIKMNLKLGESTFMCRITPNELFIIGQPNLSSFKLNQKVFKYNLNTRSITKLPKMLTPKLYAVMEVIGNYIYVIGLKKIKSKRAYNRYYAERFDIINHKWESLGKLHLLRSFIECFKYNGKLYVCGDTVTNNCIEVYNEGRSRWELCYVPINGLGYDWNVFSFNNDIITFNSNMKTERAYKFDISKHDLIVVTPIKIKNDGTIHRLKIISIDNKYFAIDYRADKHIRIYNLNDLMADKITDENIKSILPSTITYDHVKCFGTSPLVFNYGHRRFI